MADPKERQALIEAAASAFRAQNAHGEILSNPAWEDLDEEGRKEAFDLAQKLRQLEAALDPKHLSSTTRSVLAKIRKSQTK